MLITKKLKIKWNGGTKQHYIDLGYTYTKIGDEFEIDVNDLTNGSGYSVEVKCDFGYCKDPYLHVVWKDYLNHVREGDKYYCRKCCTSLSVIENIKQRKLIRGKSFYQWCIENNRQDALDRWDYELNDCKSSEISYYLGNKIYLKCSLGIHKSELKKINSFTSGSEGSIQCKACNSFAQWGIDNICEGFLDKYWDYDKNTVDPWIITKSSGKYVWIKCQEKDYHGSYKIVCRDFNNGIRCAYCTNNHGKVHILDALGTLYPEVLNIWSDKNKKSPYEYAPMSGEYIWWKCLNGKHQNYERSIKDSTYLNFRCPECVNERNESFLQEKVRLYLEKLNYTILHEYKCTLKCINPLTNYQLPYDNEIIVNNKHLIIEVHGSQHYDKNCIFHKLSARKFKTTIEYQFEYLQYKDKYKKDFALSHGYQYLIIPYYTDDSNETWKDLINDKINDKINEIKTVFPTFPSWSVSN